MDTLKKEGGKAINGIEFSRSSFLKDMSNSKIQVTNRFLYSSNSQENSQGGFLDLKMGANKKNNCNSCGKNQSKCPGHFGYIRLFLPVLNMGYIKAVQLILSMVCKICSRLLIDPGEKRNFFLNLIRKTRKKGESYKMEYLSQLIQECRGNYSCFYCYSKNGLVKRFGTLSFVHELKNEKKKDPAICSNVIDFSSACQEKILDPLCIFRIFQGITSLDLELLDFDSIEAHPADLILSYLPVPPLGIRPSVFIGEKISNEDDLTIKLTEILFLNNRLKLIFDADTQFSFLKENWNILQIECAKYLNSDVLNLEGGIHKFKNLFSRLKGKNGRFRGNLSGKRVDFSGRTVISPDPNLPLNFLGLPYFLAKKLTFPEKVNSFNLERLQRAVFRGNSGFPGANFFTDLKNNKKNLENLQSERKDLKIKIGYRIDRHLKNNDFVFFNRQPSLHRISIMAHRIKVISGKTFKINESICKPYNADFDGDEMNIHVPQTQKARAECGTLLNLTLNINSPGNGESMIAGIQDFLSASFLLTSKDRFLIRNQVGEIFQISQLKGFEKNNLIPAILKPLELWTGKQIFSLIIFSDNSNHEEKYSIQKSKRFSESFFTFTEKNFSLGQKMCEPFLCPFDGWILFKEKNLLAGQIGKRSIGSGNILSVLSLISFSYSFDFILLGLLKISKMTSSWFSTFGFSFGIDDITPQKIHVRNKKFYIKNCYNLNNSLKKRKKVMKIKTINSKKRKEASIQKIFTILREDFGKKSMNLNRFMENSGIIMAASGSKGSINNLSQMSLCLGQQSVNGERIKNGFQKRVLPHFFPKKINLKYSKNGFIARSFFDGLGPTNFFFHAMAGREGLIDTAVKTAETGYLQRRIMKTLEDITVYYDSSSRSSDGRLVQTKVGIDGMNPGHISFLFNLNGFLLDIGKNFDKKNKILNFFEIQSFIRGFSFNNMETYSFLLNSRDFFSCSNNSFDLKKKRSFLNIENQINRILENWNKIKIEPGKSVGAIAAQSIGEPGTQMTLQTFHHAGVSELNITQGVPRINEIISASKKILSPIIKFDFSTLGNKSKFFNYRFKIEKIFLGQICEKLNIITNSDCIFIDLSFKKKILSNFDSGFSLKKIVKKIKLINITWNKSRFFFQNSSCSIRIFPYKSGGGVKFSYFDILKIIYSCKKEFPNVLISGFVNSNLITVYKNPEKTFAFIKSLSLFEVFKNLDINKKKIYCNSISIILEIFGIECSRKVIIGEIQEIFDLHEISINCRHTILMAEIMTYHGKILGLNRYGLSKMKTNTLVLASFEKTIENLFSSATNTTEDKIFGVSDNIILGKKLENGTGCVGLVQM